MYAQSSSGRKNQTESLEIEPNPSKDRAKHEGDNPSFWDEFMKCTEFYLFLNSFRIFKQVPKYLVEETFWDLQSTSRGLD
jgi:hypothetical protein